MSNIIETPSNFEQKCLCTFVLDVSSSMEGDPINELNAGLKMFYEEIADDPVMSNRLEISIVTFSDIITTELEPSLINDFSMPQLTTSGTTKLVDGIERAISIVADRKEYYKTTGMPYYRSWIILISDGAPDSDQDVDSLAARIKIDCNNKKYVFMPIGVRNADMNVLNKLCAPPIDKPLLLDGLRFKAFFDWLSASLSKVLNSKENQKIDFDTPTWTKGFTV